MIPHSLLLELPRWARSNLQLGARRRFILASRVGGLRILLLKRRERIGAATRVKPTTRKRRSFGHQTTRHHCLGMRFLRDSKMIQRAEGPPANRQQGETPSTTLWRPRRDKSSRLAGRRYTTGSSKGSKFNKMPCFLIQDSEASRCFRIPSTSRKWLILWRRQSGKRPDWSNRRKTHPTSITWATRSFRMNPQVLHIKISEEEVTTPASSKTMDCLLQGRSRNHLPKLNQQEVRSRHVREVRIRGHFLLLAAVRKDRRQLGRHRWNQRVGLWPRRWELAKGWAGCRSALVRKMLKLHNNLLVLAAVVQRLTSRIPQADKSRP